MSKESQAVAEKPNREALAKVGQQIEDIRRKHEAGLANAKNDFERGYILACSIIDLRQAVKLYMPVLKQLQGSKLGFLTDRDPGKDWKNQGPYPEEVVINCAIEAVMRGARWTGNEFNILAGGCYLTKEYWWRMVTQQIEGLTDLDLNPGVPEFANGKCVVEFQASWKLDGRPHQMSRRIPVIVRKDQSDDATLGKAEARMLKAIFRKITGTEITDQDDEGPMAPAPKAATPAAGNGAPAAIEAPKGLAEGEVPEDDRSGEAFNWNAPAEDVERERERVRATK